MTSPPLAGSLVYQLRIELQDIQPVIWRGLLVRSDLLLSELHPILQATMGWANVHLHLYEKSQVPGNPQLLRPELFVDRQSLDEGMDGVDEAQVRLSDVVTEPGEILEYAYDFGDGWQHSVTLEAVMPADHLPSGTALCLDGARSAPPEDVGGVPGYETFLDAQADPEHPDHEQYRSWLGTTFDPEAFSVTDINARLTALLMRSAAIVPAGLATLLDRVPTPVQELLWQGIFDAGLAEAEAGLPLSGDDAAHLTHPYRWLLERVGTAGITLTSAGFLPPAHVIAASAALNFGDEWIGTLNRENQTPPLLDLRESAQKLGLLRKAKGVLSVTAAGRKAVGSPEGLARHIAARLPLGTSEVEQQAGWLALLHYAAGRETDNEMVAGILTSYGWRVGSALLESHDGYQAARETRVVMERLGIAPVWRRGRRGDRTISDAGIAFARLALRSGG